MNKQLLDESITYYYGYLINKLRTKNPPDVVKQALTEAYISLLGKDLVVHNKQHCCALLFKEALFAMYRRKDRIVNHEDIFEIEWATQVTPEHNTIVKHQLKYLRNVASKDLLTYMEHGKYAKAARILGKHPVTLRQQLYTEMAVLKEKLPFKHIHEEGSTYSYYVNKDVDKDQN